MEMSGKTADKLVGRLLGKLLTPKEMEKFNEVKEKYLNSLEK